VGATTTLPLTHRAYPLNGFKRLHRLKVHEARDAKGTTVVMVHSSTRKGAATRAGLAALLLAGGVGAAQTTHGITAHASAPRVAAGSPKPDWRGADLGNSGTETVNGPVITPTQVFNANPGAGNGATQGIEFDGAGNVLFTKGDGFVYSYNPTLQTQNWAFTATGTFGNDATGAAPNPVASSDGNVYINDDSGHFYKINAGTGAGTQFLNYGAAVAQTPKLDDATGNLFFGGQDHFINSYSKTGTNNYSTTGTGSTQDGTIAGCSGAASANPLFYGEGALDSSDNFYVASFEPKTSGPRSCSNTVFGTLYKVSPTGTILAKAPLAGPAVGAVVLVPNAAVAGGSELVVDTKAGYVEAFDMSLNRLWAVKTANASNNASPAVDAGRNRVYVADTASALHALNLTTGAVDTTFNGGTTGLTGGTQSSPIIDASGNVYAVDSTGTLFKFAPTGATVYSFNTNIGTGFFSVAIDNAGTVYAGGNVGQVSGFNAAAAATTTPTVANTATTTPTVANTATTTPTVANTATTTPTVANTATTTPTVASTATTTPTVANTATTTPTVARTATTTPTVANTATTIPTVANTATTTPTVANTATTTPTVANTATTIPTVANTATTAPTSTPTAANTATTAPTSTNTPTNTATTIPTNTSTPNATATAVQQTAIAATATAQATQGVNLPNCQLSVLPNPKIVQRTGSEAALFKVLPNAPITVTISAGYVTTATLYTGAAGTPGVTINRNSDGTFTFRAGPGGRALIDFPIPSNAPTGSVTIKAVATENCAGGDPGQSAKVQPHTITRTSSFTVEAAQANSFGLHEVQSRHRILFRTVQPVGAGSVMTDSVYINTAPNVPVTTTFTISSTKVGNLGSGFTNGQQVYQNLSTSSITGSVRLKVPFSSTLLIPGKGGLLLETVQANIDGKVVTFNSRKAIREVNLRLVVQVQETTRGNRRAPFEIGNKAGGSSALTVLVLCDPKAAISGAATVGSFSLTQTATCGAGGRAKLKYSVLNSTAPAKGTGTVAVTSSYRGATKTHTISFRYSHKPGKQA